MYVLTPPHPSAAAVDVDVDYQRIISIGSSVLDLLLDQPNPNSFPNIPNPIDWIIGHIGDSIKRPILDSLYSTGVKIFLWVFALGFVAVLLAVLAVALRRWGAYGIDNGGGIWIIRRRRK